MSDIGRQLPTSSRVVGPDAELDCRILERGMDSAKRCRDQAIECLCLMKLATSQTEARVFRDIAQSWTRLANQIERYNALIASNRIDAAIHEIRSDGI